MLTSRNQQYAAYFDTEGHICVVQRDLSSGETKHTLVPNNRMPNDAHMSISIGINCDGVIHLAYGAHCSSLLVTRSISRNIEDGFLSPAKVLENVTYPMFVSAGPRLLMFYRVGQFYSGAIRCAILDDRTHKWRVTERDLISGYKDYWTTGPYLNTPIVDQKGRVHMFVVWRRHPRSTSGGDVANFGLDYFHFDEDLNHGVTFDGVLLSLPVTPSLTDRVVAVPNNNTLINQGSAALLSGDRAAAMTYWAAHGGVPQYRICWFDGERWRATPASCFHTDFRLSGAGTLPLPHSRPELVVTNDDNIILIYRSAEHKNKLLAKLFFAPNYDLEGAKCQILIDDDLGFYEPVIDRTGWMLTGELSIYIQRCSQGLHRDGLCDRDTAPAQIMTWRLTGL